MRQVGDNSERTEVWALLALGMILIGLPLLALGYQFALRPALASVRVIDIVAAAPEAGGFQPENIRVAAGERVRLRFYVPDVTHGIAIGPGLGLDLGHVDPGQVKEIEVSFDQPGRYALYCNIWCSPNHWRMRGTIEVYDPQRPDALPPSEPPDPVLESLAARGMDIDAPHPARSVPAEPPSAARGRRIVEQLGQKLPPDLADAEWRRTHSPVDAWDSLLEVGLGETEAWDAVAYLWLSGLDAQAQRTSAALYAKNCAACHGESGDGQGPGAKALAAQGIGPRSSVRGRPPGDMGEQHSGMSTGGKPAAFADPGTMLGGSSQVYYAKLRRGGMGTGMPSFGPILTPEETWLLVEYLWTFVFD